MARKRTLLCVLSDHELLDSAPAASETSNKEDLRWKSRRVPPAAQAATPPFPAARPPIGSGQAAGPLKLSPSFLLSERSGQALRDPGLLNGNLSLPTRRHEHYTRG